jgi:hypothetical protein
MPPFQKKRGRGDLKPTEGSPGGIKEYLPGILTRKIITTTFIKN